MFFWIDLKNLSSANVLSVINRLDFITRQNFLKDRIIIESKDIELLYQLKVSGYKISYWLPSFHFLNSIFQVYEIRDDLKYYSPDAFSVLTLVLIFIQGNFQIIIFIVGLMD